MQLSPALISIYLCWRCLKIVQKLSTRMPSRESRMKALKEIASENNIVLQLDEFEEKLDVKNENQPGPEKQEKEKIHALGNAGKDYQFSDSPETRKKYKDVADAAQAAFESAAYAAAAARAAVELSRSASRDPPPNDGHGISGEIKSQVIDKEIVPSSDDDNTRDDDHGNSEEFMSQELDEEIAKENRGKEFNKSDIEEAMEEATVSVAAEVDAHHPMKEEPVFDVSDHEHEGKVESFKEISPKSHDDKVAGFDTEDPILKADAGSKKQSKLSMNLEKLKKPFSVRTRRVWGF